MPDFNYATQVVPASNFSNAYIPARVQNPSTPTNATTDSFQQVCVGSLAAVDWSNINFAAIPSATLQALGAALIAANALPNLLET